MKLKILSIIFILLMIFIFIPKPVTASAPTITVYGISPINAVAGTWVRCWLTYTDADNDAPTYVRCTRTLPTGFAQLQVPNTMIANDTDDTTYSDGKQYYYNWYYFPFIGTGFIKFMVKSGADAEVTKTNVEYQEPAPTLTHSGITPIGNITGNYTFFTNFTDIMNGIPTYVQIVIDGTTHSMNKNNSTQLTWVTGVDYSYTENLTIGNHTYSFEAMGLHNYAGKQTSGVYWIVIQNQTTPIDWNLIGIVIIIIAFIIIIMILVIYRKKD